MLTIAFFKVIRVPRRVLEEKKVYWLMFMESLSGLSLIVNCIRRIRGECLTMEIYPPLPAYLAPHPHLTFALKLKKFSSFLDSNSQRLTCLTDGRKWIPDWIVERLSPQTRLSIPLLTYLHHVVLRDEVSGVSKGDSRIWEKWLSLETFRFGIPIILDEPGYILSLSNFEF